MAFYLGANYLLGKNDYRKSAEYLMEASELPGSPSFLPTLAARLAYYSGETKLSILFLKGLLEDTADPVLRAKMQKRLDALEGALLIEEAVQAFKAQEGRSPASVTELVERQFLEVEPIEPYGGTWIVSPEGRVYSTSKFTDAD